jgi:PST family polysaccharide transporter
VKAIKAYFYTSFSQVARLATAFIITKMIALYLGPTGMGELGNFMTLSSALFIISGGGILSGVISTIAKFRHDRQFKKEFLAATFTYSMSFSVILLILFLVFKDQMNSLIFPNQDSGTLLVVLFGVQFIYAITNLITGYINGIENTKLYSIMIIIGNLIALPMSYYLIKEYQFIGSGFAIILPNVLIFLPALYFSKKLEILPWFKLFLNKDHFKTLSRFSIMTIFSATLYPIAEILVRSVLIENLGMHQAGLFQGLWKLSSVYLSFMTTFLSFYYLPQISQNIGIDELNKRVLKMFVSILGLFLLGAILFMILDKWIVRFALSADFDEVLIYVKYQLAADLLKVTGYVFGFVILSRADYRKYIVIELVQAGAFIGLTHYFISQQKDLQSVYFANLLGSFLYFLTVFYFYRRLVKQVKAQQVNK